RARFQARICSADHCLLAEGTSREAGSWRSDRRIASSPDFRAAIARASTERSRPKLLPCIVRPGETGGIGKGWQGRSSSQSRLGGHRENRKYSRNLETTWCRYSTG